MDSNTATVSITVLPAPPVANNQSVTVAFNTAKAITLTGSGTGTLTYSVMSSPANGTLSGTAPNLTYTPTTGYFGSDSFTFKTNNGMDSNTATVSITVLPAAPVANNQTVAVPFNTPTAITLTASGSGTLTYSVVTPPAQGTLSGTAPNLTYTPNASYSGSDSFTFKANNGTDSNTATVSITKVSTTTAVTSSQNASVFGQSVTFTATVSPSAPGAGTPTGMVTFLDGGNSIYTGTLSGGVATFTTSALAAGNHTITANYAGDASFSGSAASLTGNPQVVNKASTTSAVISSQNPSSFGQSVTFTATVSPSAPGAGTPTGTVTFLDGGSSIGTGTLSGGVATFSTSSLAAANHTITTSYAGDGSFNGGTGTLTGNPQVVTSIDLIVSKTHNPSTFTVNDINDNFTITVKNQGTTASNGTITVTDTLPAGLTFNGSPTAGWTCNANGSNPVICTTVNAIAGSGGISALVINVNVAGSTGSPLSNNVAVACTCTESNTTNNTGSDIVTVAQVVNVTLDTSPTGLQISIDGGMPFTAPHVYQFTPNSVHTIATTSPQTSPGTQFIFLSWSDGGAISHAITTPSSPTTYTANFKTQYLLTTQVSPGLAAGSISPASGLVDAGTVVSVSATANAGYAFTGFTGALTGATNPQNLTVNAPSTVTANFMALPDLSINKSHPGGAGGHFSQGQLGATYSITVGNNGPGASSGTVTVTDTIPSGLTLVSMSGTGWTCGPPNANNVCTRSDSVGSGGSYEPITVTVNVGAGAPATVTNTATVSGNGDYNLSNNRAMDPTTINPITDVSANVSVTQSGFGRNRATGIWSATMTVTNTTGAPISGPIQVVLTNLTAGVTMWNNTGIRNGSPYITVSPGTLAPGAAVSVSIQFQNPSNGFITYTPVTDSGTF